MTGKSKKSFKSQSLVVEKVSAPIVEAVVKLTKQKKRDLKRSENTSSTAPSSTAPDEGVKLTKQQKRDKKRNGISHAERGRGHHAVKPPLTQVQQPNATTLTSVYKRKTEYPSLYLSQQDQQSSFSIPQERFMTQQDASYDVVIEAGYQGFVHSPTESFSSSFHSKFEEAMIGLEREGKYQYDVTQPAGLGTKVAKTYVTRCVVGDPGTTYKYLGLRMFSIPWTKGSTGSSPHSVHIGELNQDMIKKSQQLLVGRDEAGTCQYNLTLINR
jgi:hypothetical protein